MKLEQLAKLVLDEWLRQNVAMHESAGMSPRVQEAVWNDIEDRLLTDAADGDPSSLQTFLSQPTLRDALSPQAWRYISENLVRGARENGEHELTLTQRKHWGGRNPAHSMHNVAILYDQVRLILQLKFPDHATNDKAISITAHLAGLDDENKLINYLKKHPRPRT